MNGDSPSQQPDLREVIRAKHDAIIAMWKTVTKVVIAVGALIVTALSVMTYRISVQAVESRKEISSDLDTLKMMFIEAAGPLIAEQFAANRTNYAGRGVATSNEIFRIGDVVDRIEQQTKGREP